MTNSERIEAYFNNELPDAERQQLLNDVDSDATLKSEFQFQQEVIDGIKAYRKKELIARLDQVKIASTGSSILIKTLSVVGIATVATIGTYLWVNNSTNDVVNTTKLNNTEQIISEPNKQPSKILTSKTEDQKKETASASQQSSKDKSIETPKSVVKEIPSNTPEIIIPSVTEPSDSSNEIVTDDDLEAPEAMSSSEIKLSTNTNVEVKFSKKYAFHYQIKQGRLTLYGDFGDTPFEVIELKTNRGLNSYLYFGKHFYCLKTDTEKIRPLEAIEDKTLIQELQKRR